MRILYGVVGEGMGHATRSKVLLRHLVSLGHEVLICVSGRAYEFLRKAFGDDATVEIRGLTIRYTEGRMDRDATVAHNVVHAPGMLLENAGAYFERVRAFRPDLVISDFDSFTHAYGRIHGVPVISVDNQQVIPRCRHDDSVLDGHRAGFETTRAFVKLKLPGCLHYVVTSFFFPPVKEKYAADTTLVPPILREEILRATPSDGGHVLVYQTSVSDSRLLEVLHAFPEQRFVVYGLRRDEDRGHVQLKNFAEQGFVDDLASSRAVVANGGLSLIGEALALGKPVYTVPVEHQFEQVLNAAYIVQMGLGMTSASFDEDVLGAFLKDADHFARRVRSEPRHDRNETLFRTVDGLLAGV